LAHLFPLSVETDFGRQLIFLHDSRICFWVFVNVLCLFQPGDIRKFYCISLTYENTPYVGLFSYIGGTFVYCPFLLDLFKTGCFYSLLSDFVLVSELT